MMPSVKLPWRALTYLTHPQLLVAGFEAPGGKRLAVSRCRQQPRGEKTVARVAAALASRLALPQSVLQVK